MKNVECLSCQNLLWIQQELFELEAFKLYEGGIKWRSMSFCKYQLQISYENVIHFLSTWTHKKEYSKQKQIEAIYLYLNLGC